MASNGTPRILIVEDNDVDFRILKHAFSSTGIPHEIDGVDNGESALEYLLRGPGANEETAPRLIMLDLNLPKLGGLEVLRAVKAHAELRRIPVAVISSSQFQSDILGAYDLGASLYVRKPNDLAALEELVKAIATTWLKYALRPQMTASAAVSFDAAQRQAS